MRLGNGERLQRRGLALFGGAPVAVWVALKGNDAFALVYGQ